MIAVLGGAGQLGSAFMHLLGTDARTVTRSELDLADLRRIPIWLDEATPSLVINCAAFTHVDRAEAEPEEARRINADAVETLATETAQREIGFVTFSTDYVFDGTKGDPYVESDPPNPVNVYGATKLEGERLAMGANPDALVVRTSWVLSGTHPNFARTILRLLAAGPVAVVDDQFGRPTLVEDLAPAVMEAVGARVSGVLHLTNQGAASWCSFAREIASIAGMDESEVRPIGSEESDRPAKRPPDGRLDSERVGPEGLTPLPHYRASLERAVAAILSSGGTP